MDGKSVEEISSELMKLSKQAFIESMLAERLQRIPLEIIKYSRMIVLGQDVPCNIGNR